ncbi:MAG: portal protein, partial [Planctomycetota bacterium]
MPAGQAAKPHHRFDNWVIEAVSYLSDQRDRADKALDYRDGDQWSPEDAAQLEERHQPISVLNIVQPIHNMVRAVEMSRRTDYIVVGREPSDDATADALTKLLAHTFEQESFPYFLGEQFDDGALTGIGWMEVGVEKDHDLDQKFVKLYHRPWEEMIYDPFARHPLLLDARYMGRRIYMDRDMAKAKFPKKAHLLDNDDNLEYEKDGEHRGQEAEAQSHTTGEAEQPSTNRNRRIVLTELYYKDAKGKMRYVLFSGPTFLEGTEDDDEKNKSPFKYNVYPYIPFLAWRDKKGRPRGIYDMVLPIQDHINKLMSKFTWNHSSNQVMYEEGAFDDPEAIKQEIAKPDAFIPVRPGMLDRVRKEKRLDENAQLVAMMNIMFDISQRQTGVNDALLGIGGTNARS